MIKTYKSVGLTPLEVVENIRKKYPELQQEKLAYAGRLDPMAEGELLILVGEECKNRKEFEKLDKEYEFEVLFGVSTDTYDVLGKITDNTLGHLELNSGLLTEKLQNSISQFVGKQRQKYPPYSSPRIKGKSLWWWANERRLDEIKIPEKEIEIYKLELLETHKKNVTEMYDQIVKKIQKVRGNFRQEEILKGWKNISEKNKTETVPVAKLRIYCSSGTYVRSIGNDIGKKLKIPTVVYSLKRTKIITNKESV